MDSETNRWSKLPKDLLIMVAKRLDSSTDILRLCAVCSSWRSLLPRSTKKDFSLFSVKFPFPIDPNPPLSLRRHGHFALSERTIYYVEPSTVEKPNASASSAKSWMVSVEELDSRKMEIYDIFSKLRFLNLPEFSSKVVNLLNFRVSEVSKVCMFYFVTHQNDADAVNYDFAAFEFLIVKKVVMSCVPAWTNDSSVDCAVLTIHTGGKLGYFKLGDTKWSMINDGQMKAHYVDIAYRKGKFYAVDATGRVIVIDSSLNVRAIESPVPQHGVCALGGQHKYLVESLGDLYLIDKYPNDGQGENYLEEDDSDECEDKEGDWRYWFMYKFVVYKFKDGGQEWIRVTSLGDRSFFVGDDCCFSVSASQFSGCKGNCIYFTDFQFFDKGGDHPGNCAMIFDLENGRMRRLSSFKSYSQIFWPPPTWLKPKSSSKRSKKRSSKRSSKPSSSRS